MAGGPARAVPHFTPHATPMSHRRAPEPHIPPEDLVSLDDGTLRRAAAARARSHLAGCPICRQDYERISRWNAAVAALSPATVVATHWGGLLAESVERAMLSEPDGHLRARLVTWHDTQSGRADAAIRVQFDASGLPSTTAEGLGDVALRGAAWRLLPVPPRVPYRARLAGARGEAVAFEAPIECAASLIIGPGRMLTVHVPLRSSVTLPLTLPIVLVAAEGARPRVELMRHSDDGWVARFEDLDADEVLVAFEPASSISRSD